MRTSAFLLAGLTALTLALPARAQTTTVVSPGKGGSPHVRTTWSVDGAKIAIEYGRPSLKGRAESLMMPAGKPWRTGADEATVITTDKPLTFGKVTLAPGSYTINTEPGATSWQLIFGKLAKAGQWGIPYQPALEMSRTPMAIAKAPRSVEQLTFLIDHPKQGPALRIVWGTASATAPFTVGK